jgi:hypothetical protein
MKFSSVFALLVTVLITGCANTPQVPQESPISIQLKGTSTEVQNFIEDRIRRNGNGVFSVENANDRLLTLKANCNRLPNQKPMQCGLIMMGVGNSRWDGPYLMLNFRTNQIRENVNVTVQSEWCAINALGKSNCMPAGNINENNDILRGIKTGYDSEIRN